MSIAGNAVGGLIIPKSFVLVDENNVELVGVTVGEETVLTADPKTDIREGKIAATEDGVVTGSKVIPAYETTQKTQLILPGAAYSIPLSAYNRYNYTKFQGIIAKYNADPTKRMAANKIVIDDSVYSVNSSEVLSDVTKNAETKSIDLNIINDTEEIYMIYFFTYKQT